MSTDCALITALSIELDRAVALSMMGLLLRTVGHGARSAGVTVYVMPQAAVF